MKPILFSTPMVQAILAGKKTQTRRVIEPQTKYTRWTYIGWLGWGDGHDHRIREPYKLSDIREPYKLGDVLWVRETWAADGDHADGTQSYIYRADGDVDGVTWKPSIFMPKSAARIFLKVTGISIRCISKISEFDAEAEGAVSVQEFREIWDEIYKNRGYGWDTNPIGWMIEFKRIERP